MTAASATKAAARSTKADARPTTAEARSAKNANRPAKRVARPVTPAAHPTIAPANAAQTAIDPTDNGVPAPPGATAPAPGSSAPTDVRNGLERLNLKQLLLARSEWFADEIMKGVERSDYAFISPAQSRLLAVMAGKPTHMAELARRLAISRQAVHKTVGELARRGLLALLDDPERGNSKLVVYTERGRLLNRAGVRMIEQTEARIAARIGQARLDTLRALLAADWG